MASFKRRCIRCYGLITAGFICSECATTAERAERVLYEQAAPIIERELLSFVRKLIEQAAASELVQMHRTTISPRMREKVLSRDFYMCCLCLSQKNIGVHHKIKAIRGGKADESNLVTLCAQCNLLVDRGNLSRYITKQLPTALRNHFELQYFKQLTALREGARGLKKNPENE